MRGVILKSSYLIYSFIVILLFLAIGCAPTKKLIFDRERLTTEEFNRDKYECVQQSKVNWGGGGTGALGIVMILSSKSSADNQANEMFKMCMEARGYTAREVSDEEFENNKTFADMMKPANKMARDLCKKEEYKIVFIKSACEAKDVTYEQLSDKSMISDIEKSICLKVYEERLAIRKRIFDTLQASENPRSKEYILFLKKDYDKGDKVFLDLVNGKISWGEYNKFKKEKAEEIKKELRIWYSNN